MKKVIFTFFVLLTSLASHSQTLLNSHSLELKKSSSYYQILNAVNNQDQVFVFASDKENLKVLKYNKALFFTDSISVLRPEKDYEFMAGYSFEKNGNPYLYWASGDYSKIQSVYFDFEKNTASNTFHQISFKGETILNTFSENNSFYILSLPEKEPKLKLYVFNNGKLEEKVLDFTSYKFMDGQGKSKIFNELLDDSPIEKIDTKSANPLFQCVGKTKLYCIGNRMILTFDSLSRTQLFEINLDTFSIDEKIIPSQALSKSVGKSNSYFHQDKLYQIKTNEEELIIAAIDLKSGELLKSYTANPKDSISFKNSPLYSQSGNQKGQAIKNTKKFLQKLKNTEVGISVYKTPNSTMVTVGGVRDVASTGGILLAITAGATMITTGNNFPIDVLFSGSNLQSIYFESLFDDTFQHQNIEQQGLAIDYISRFIDENETSLESVFPYKDYFILGYYNSKIKEYVMRKFEDSTN